MNFLRRVFCDIVLRLMTRRVRASLKKEELRLKRQLGACLGIHPDDLNVRMSCVNGVVVPHVELGVPLSEAQLNLMDALMPSQLPVNVRSSSRFVS